MHCATMKFIMSVTLESMTQNLAQNFICIYRHMTCSLTEAKVHFEDLGERDNNMGMYFRVIINDDVN